MNGDPNIWRRVGCCLIVLCIVCLAIRHEVPLLVLLPTLAFFAWRWRVRRVQKRPGTQPVVAQEHGGIEVAK